MPPCRAQYLKAVVRKPNFCSANRALVAFQAGVEAFLSLLLREPPEAGGQFPVQRLLEDTPHQALGHYVYILCKICYIFRVRI
jgi:hypothetical protein